MRTSARFDVSSPKLLIINVVCDDGDGPSQGVIGSHENLLLDLGAAAFVLVVPLQAPSGSIRGVPAERLGLRRPLAAS